MRAILFQFLQRLVQAARLAQNHILVEEQLAVLEVVVARLKRYLEVDGSRRLSGVFSKTVEN